MQLPPKDYKYILLYRDLHSFGFPVHYEVLTTKHLNINLNYSYWNDPDFQREARKVQRALSQMIKDGYVRRKMPGVYSAFGPERD